MNTQNLLQRLRSFGQPGWTFLQNAPQLPLRPEQRLVRPGIQLSGERRESRLRILQRKLRQGFMQDGSAGRAVEARRAQGLRKQRKKRIAGRN